MRIARSAALGRVCIVVLYVAAPEIGTAAESETDYIVWNAENGCPSREIFIGKIHDVLGEIPVDEKGRRFVGSAVREREKWRATLETRDTGQVLRRSLRVSSCDAATEVVALLVALAIDPMSVLGSEDENVRASLKTISASADDPQSIENAGVPEASSPEPASVENSVEPMPEPQPKEKSPQTAETPVKEATKVLPRNRWGQLGIDFDADVGTDGGFRPAVAIFGGFLWKALRVELSARYLPAKEESVDGVPGGRYESRLAGFSLGIGLQWQLGRFRIGPTVGAALHGLFAESSGVALPGNGAAWFASIWAGGHLEWQATERLGLRFVPSLHYLPERPRFNIEGVGTVLHPAVITGSFRLGIFFHF